MRSATSGLLALRVTIVYGVLLAGVYAWLLTLSPAQQQRIFADTSTNLHNLRHGHFGTLVTSAFVVDAGPIANWLPGLLCILAIAELLWRSGRLIVALVVGHVGATLLVGVGLAAAVTWGWLNPAVVVEEDVGMSYAATAVLGTVTAALPRRWRPAWIGWWLAVGATAIVMNADFADVGHTVALLLGMLVATRFGAPRPWTPPLIALCCVAATFGFLVMTQVLPVMTAAGACGLAAIGLVEAIRWLVQRNSSADASIQSDSHEFGGSSSSSPGISHS
jgi:hypothetical protein